ncbi:hypothetical protein V497_01507 [Pseudogymnoascus sp. VKM F-4516 (FW-969)]|nr:hypothetical protein V497_01507 [Pseudogymnoascus sp. VKM F-4516 (FW-969)]
MEMDEDTFTGGSAEHAGQEDLQRHSNRPDKQAQKGASQSKSSTRRACNECRQQKLRCDIIQDPFTACSRCRRLALHCRIDTGFKRVEKRKAKVNRQWIEPQRSQTIVVVPASSKSPVSSTFTDNQSSTIEETAPSVLAHMLPIEPVLSSYLDLVDDSPETQWSEICGVRQATTIPDTVRAHGRNYAVVKQRQEPYGTDSQARSFPRVAPRKLDGIELAADSIQILFEQPGNAQDFSKFRIRLSQEDLEDRMKTWAACNIVMQSVATGYGQPSMTLYDWALSPRLPNRPDYQLGKYLGHRLRIEKLCDRITKALYYDVPPTSGATENSDNIGVIRLLDQELVQLGAELTFILFYLRCATLHLRLYALVEPGKPESIISSLLSLYEACRQLLSMLITAEPPDQEPVEGNMSLLYCPNYTFQMTLAASCTLLRLLRSSFKGYIDVDVGKSLFNSVILAVRKMSIANNDLPGRLADVLAQLWAKDARASKSQARLQLGSEQGSNIRQEVQLKVRGRMSMSVMFDSLLEWRKSFEVNASREPSPPIQSHQERLSSQNAPQGVIQALPATVGQESDMNPYPPPLEWTFDEFPYDDSFYPLNWIVDGTGDTLSVPSRGDKSME